MLRARARGLPRGQPNMSVPTTEPSQRSQRSADTQRGRRTYAALCAGVLAVGLCALALGHGDLGDRNLRDILLSLRAVRIAAAFLTGASLAVAGVLVQGLFRNPLASPSVLGTTAGASLGGQLALLSFQLLLAKDGAPSLQPSLVVPIGCLLGALLSLLVVLAIARRNGELLVLLLVGFILSSLLLSIGDFIISLSQESWELGRAMVAFVLGGLSGTGTQQVALATPLVACALVAAWLWGRPLDLMLSGEEEAASLGVDVPQLRLWTVIWASILTGAAVSIGGNVGFVGLVVPHALRGFVGVEHRKLVPACALAGGGFVVLCDLISRAVPAHSEVPLSVVTGLVGAPVFLSLLLRMTRGDGHV